MIRRNLPQPAASCGNPPRPAAHHRVPRPCIDAIANPATSFWLRRAITSLLQRDPVDAVNDAEALLKLMQDRLRVVEEELRHG